MPCRKYVGEIKAGRFGSTECLSRWMLCGILTDLSPRPSVGLCVCLSVRKVYCGKMAEWIRVLFGTESVVGQGMGVLDGVDVLQEEGVSEGDSQSFYPIRFTGALLSRNALDSCVKS